MRQALGVFALLLAACAGAPTPPAVVANASTAAQSAPPKTPALAPLTASGIRELPDVAEKLAAARVSGTVALFDTQEGVLGCSDVERCQRAESPASTFKIPHSMVALETGVVDGPDTLLRWDGQTYSNADWNRDLTFRDAFRLSCVPCFRGIAEKVGKAGEQAWVDKLGYGNHDASGDTVFWLKGGLRISPVEQIAFLRRFDGDQLPISSRTADIVRDVMTLDITENYVLRGKTGSADQPREVYWFVGWLELGARRVFFATCIDSYAPDVDPLIARRAVTEQILRSRGWM